MQYRLAWPPFTRNIKLTLGGLVFLWLVAFEIDGVVQRYMLVSRDALLVDYHVWTLLSYAFWHFEFSHILFNGLALWMFGGELDRRLGDSKFWTLSLASALGGGVAIVLTQLLFGTNHPTLGYSGAVMGLVAAYCWFQWDRSLHFFFARLKGKHLLLLFVGLDFLLAGFGGQPISISGHIGGMITGLLIVSGYWRPGRLVGATKRWWRKRKFKTHSRTPDRKRNGRWIN